MCFRIWQQQLSHYHAIYLLLQTFPAFRFGCEVVSQHVARSDFTSKLASLKRMLQLLYCVVVAELLQPNVAAQGDSQLCTFWSSPTGGECTCAGTVRYAQGSNWYSKANDSTITCSNAGFGDPIYGTVKSCCWLSYQVTCYGKHQIGGIYVGGAAGLKRVSDSRPNTYTSKWMCPVALTLVG